MSAPERAPRLKPATGRDAETKPEKPVALDQETIDTVRRAQPFPPPPANMPGETFDFTVPIRFNIR